VIFRFFFGGSEDWAEITTVTGAVGWADCYLARFLAGVVNEGGLERMDAEGGAVARILEEAEWAMPTSLTRHPVSRRWLDIRRAFDTLSTCA
jgi:hypothetical protein